jgi:hypothetical protein
MFTRIAGSLSFIGLPAYESAVTGFVVIIGVNGNNIYRHQIMVKLHFFLAERAEGLPVLAANHVIAVIHSTNFHLPGSAGVAVTIPLPPVRAREGPTFTRLISNKPIPSRPYHLSISLQSVKLLTHGNLHVFGFPRM